MKAQKRFLISDDFKSYLPPQRPEETDTLRLKIEMEGCRPGSLTVANIPGDGRYLIDGHHTFAICEEKGVPLCEPIVVNLPNKDEAKAWMRQNQLAKRNLTDHWWSQLLGEEYAARKQPHGSQPRCHSEHLEDSKGKTAEHLAEEYGTSPATVRRAAEFSEAVNTLADGDAQAKQTILASDATKKQIVAAPNVQSLFCRPCRVGVPKKGCKDCKAMRKSKEPREPGVEEPAKRKPKSEKAGAVVFDWRVFNDGFGLLVRQVDKLGKAFDAKESREAERLRKRLAEFKEEFTDWHRKLTARK